MFFKYIFETQFAWCGLVGSDKGLRQLSFALDDQDLVIDQLAKGFSIAPIVDAEDLPPWAKQAVEKIKAHLKGTSTDLSEIPIDWESLNLSGFQEKVYRFVRKIPAGEVLSYEEVANAINRKGASRAVGGAMAKNPLLFVIPCHRVMGKNGKLTGFSAPGGVETKKKLLALEGLSSPSFV